MMTSNVCDCFTPARHRGSVSAEHGLGFMKAQYIYHSKSREAVTWMKKLKQLFDPNVSPEHLSQSIGALSIQGILNPYKTLPPN